VIAIAIIADHCWPFAIRHDHLRVVTLIVVVIVVVAVLVVVIVVVVAVAIRGGVVFTLFVTISVIVVETFVSLLSFAYNA
jgi:hypothetical protein